MLSFLTIWLFVMRFRFSGALFVRGYRAIDAESLQDGLQRGFERFGGVMAGLRHMLPPFRAFAR